MDYHFFVSDKFVDQKKVLRKFLPVFLIFLTLPFLLLLANRPSSLRFLAKARDRNELRVWMEPRTYLVNVGQPFELGVVASFEGPQAVSALRLELNSGEFFVVDKSFLELTRPFRGKTKVGNIKVTALKKGSYNFGFLEGGVKALGFGDELQIVTSSVRVVVR